MEMMAIDDDDNTEEDIIVYAEFDDTVNIEKFRSVHLLGVTDKSPIVQMDDTFFTGKYVNPLGTLMFFEEDKNPQSMDPLFDKLPEKNLKYLFKTTKSLKMETAYVQRKDGEEQTTKAEPDEVIAEVNFKTVEEALKEFKSEFQKDSVVQNNQKLEEQMKNTSDK